MLVIKQFKTPKAVAKGRPAIIDLDLMERLYEANITVGDDGTASAGINGDLNAYLDAVIDKIYFKINSNVVRDIGAGSLLNKLNSRHGSKYAATSEGVEGEASFRAHLGIFLAEWWRVDINDQFMPAWNLGFDDTGKRLSSAQIEVHFKNGGGLGDPVLSGWAKTSKLVGDGKLGAITKWVRPSFTVAGTEFDLDLEKKGVIQAVHLLKDSADITVDQINLKLNDVDVLERLTRNQNNTNLVRHDITPMTDVFSLEFDMEDSLRAALRANQLSSMALRINRSGAGAANLPVVIERMENLAGV